MRKLSRTWTFVRTTCCRRQSTTADCNNPIFYFLGKFGLFKTYEPEQIASIRYLLFRRMHARKKQVLSMRTGIVRIFNSRWYSTNLWMKSTQCLKVWCAGPFEPRKFATCKHIRFFSFNTLLTKNLACKAQDLWLVKNQTSWQLNRTFEITQTS